MARGRRTEYFPLRGGINTETPALSVAPGELIDCRNYEHALTQGYKRCGGYERFDGQQSPADESYWILDFDAGENEPSSGDIITGGTSSATGLYVGSVVESGSWVGNDAAGYLVLRSVNGSYQDNESLDVGPTHTGTSASLDSQRGADTDTLDETYLQQAMEDARGVIAAVPGSGNVLGVWRFNEVMYAFRNDAGETETCMYKSTTGGWEKVDLGGDVRFDTGGTTPIAVGDTVVGATSGASAVITKVVVNSGSWSGSDAAGYLHYTSVAGGPFQSGENLQVAAVTRAVSAAAGVSYSIPVDGTYEFENHNFYGATDRKEAYGVNGVGNGFAFDGTNFYQIYTGMDNDKPNHLAAHKNHLFFSFPGGSIQHSSIGEPYVWSPITGASEIALGDDCTGLNVLPGEALLMTCRNSRHILKGSNSSDWSRETHNEHAGAIEWSIQDMGFPMYLDDRGIQMFAQSDTFGDFAASVMSHKFQDTLDAYKDLLTTTVRSRTKSQYRMFFSSNVVLVVTMSNNKMLGATLLEYDDPIYCACSAENSDGDEVIFGGSSDGWVYQLDKGNNFDGDDIDAWLRMTFSHFRSPELRKRFFKMILELDANATIDIAFLAEFGYGDPYYPIDTEGNAVNIIGGGGYWDVDTWERFNYDAAAIAKAFGYLQGIGENISLFIRTVGSYDDTHTVQGVTFHLSDMGLIR